MSTVTQSERLLTADEYWDQANDNDLPTELVMGKVIEVPPPGYRHGTIQIEIGFLLREFVRKHDLGSVASESGLITRRSPDSVRGPDIAFYSRERIPKGEAPVGYVDAPPEVIFEILSPSQPLSQLREKADEYLAAGVLYVCIVVPGHQSVMVHQPNKAVTILTEDDTLHLPPPLDEWHPRVGDFFPE